MEMKTCPECKCPCLSKAEFCICGHKFNLAIDMLSKGNSIDEIFSELFKK